MNLWLWIAVAGMAWCAVSVPVALLVGRVIAHGESVARSTETHQGRDRTGVEEKADDGRQPTSPSVDSADPYRPLVITEAVPQEWVDETAGGRETADSASTPDKDPARPLIITPGVPEEWVTLDAEARAGTSRPLPPEASL